MKTPTSHDHRDIDADQAMTPMIDVVFLLLIFFVCASAGQIAEALLPTELSAGSLETVDAVQPETPLGDVWLYLRRDSQNRTVVQVNEGGVEHVDVSRAAVRAELRSQLLALAGATTEIPVILDIDDDVSVGDFINVYDICRAAKFDSINFATDVTGKVEANE
jgi:biopolymer transport protein ExbD